MMDIPIGKWPGKATIGSKGRFFGEGRYPRSPRVTSKWKSPVFAVDSRSKMSCILLSMRVGDVDDDADFVRWYGMAVFVLDLGLAFL